MSWIPVLALILGFITLVWSADRFLNGAAATANHLGMSKIMIGLTVVALGTSAPEILVALMAAYEDSNELAVGNAIGSNIANIGLVLGITAIIAPLPFARTVLKTELPWLLGITLVAGICLFNSRLTIWDSLVLLGLLVGLLYLLIADHRKGARAGAALDPTAAPAAVDELGDSLEDIEELTQLTPKQATFWLIVGLVVLLVSARVLVWAATQIAESLGVSDLIIGLTVVAVGTSLPELAATVGAALKGHTDIAIGNVVGSNILNILAVMSIPGLFGTVELGGEVLWRDYGMMLALTLLLALFAYGLHTRAVITRFEGAILLVAWVGYNLLLSWQS